MPFLAAACCALLIAVIILSLKVYLMKKSAGELRRGLADKLDNDTNTLIDISSRDKEMRMLAVSLNDQLKKLRNKRQRYEQGDSELKEAVTNISHDLRTPLTAIGGYLDLMERDNTDEKMSRYIGMIRSRTELMKQLTEELFRYSIVLSVQETKPEKLYINDVLEETLATFYGVITQRNIVPKIEITETKVKRELDRSALARIFSNIISNALKYSDGDFFVRLYDDGKIRFSNTAKNLTSVDVGRLFDRFYTVETAGNSTGLGLSIAKLLTERMGGVISAELCGEHLVIELKFI